MVDNDPVARFQKREVGDLAKRNHLKRLFIGNPDVYAIYSTGPDGTGREGRWGPNDGRRPFSDAILDRHLRGEVTLGTYVVKGTEAKNLWWDIDILDAADAVYARDGLINELMELGISRRHIGVTTTGNRGYHVVVPLATWVSAADARRLVQAAGAGLMGKIDRFPRQDVAVDLGNLIRLPFGKNQATGRWAEFVGPVPLALPVSRFNDILSDIPVVEGTGHGEAPAPFPCMNHAQEGPPEGQRNTLLTHLATMLRRSGLIEENVEHVVRLSNEKSADPLPDREVDSLLESSKRSGPLCGQLEGTPSHCGGACMLARKSGLWSRPNALRYAAAGEAVVVRVTKHEKGVVDVEHEDGQGRIAVKRVE